MNRIVRERHLPPGTLAQLAELALVPPELRERFGAHVQEAFWHAAGYLAWADRQRSGRPSSARLRAVAKGLRQARAALANLSEAEAFELLGGGEKEPAQAIARHVALLEQLASSAEAAAGPKGRPPASPSFYSAAEVLVLELYRAAALNEGAFGLDKRRRRGTILKAWELIAPHCSLRRPSLDSIGRLITEARLGLKAGGLPVP